MTKQCAKRARGGWLVAVMVGAWALAGCNPEPDATCVRCNTAFTAADCARFAAAAGCARGEPQTMTSCSTGPQTGCQFYGCPTGMPVCGIGGAPDAGSGDGGP